MTYQHTETARAIARTAGFSTYRWQDGETVYGLDEGARVRGWAGIGIGPVGRHRDSDLLAESNWSTVTADLAERFGEEGEDGSPWEVLRFRHFGVGWAEEIAYDTGHPVAGAVQEWRDRLDGHPVADEDAFSAAEYEEALDYLTDIWRIPEDYAADVYGYLYDSGEEYIASDGWSCDEGTAFLALAALTNDCLTVAQVMTDTSTAERDQAVSMALELGVPASTVADTLRVSRQRVYQLRDRAEGRTPCECGCAGSRDENGIYHDPR